MSTPKVFVTRQIPPKGLDVLARDCEVLVHAGRLPPTREELLRGVEHCAGVLSLLSDQIDREVLEAAGDQLKVVSNFAVGFNNIDVREATTRGVAVGNTPDVLTDATADIALALLLSAARQLPRGERDVRSGQWRTWEPLGWIGMDLVGFDAKPKTIGIIGMGRIGEAVARRLHGGWGMQVLYTSRTRKAEIDRELSARHVSLDELLRESDFVSVHVALNAETMGLLGSEEFALMKSTAVLVNTARGEVIDQEALVEALKSRSIFGAGLDVCTPEPLPVNHPLLGLDNCQVLPHIGSATTAARDAMAERAAQNILAGINGEKLPYPVNDLGKDLD